MCAVRIGRHDIDRIRIFVRSIARKRVVVITGVPDCLIIITVCGIPENTELSELQIVGMRVTVRLIQFNSIVLHVQIAAWLCPGIIIPCQSGCHLVDRTVVEGERLCLFLAAQFVSEIDRDIHSIAVHQLTIVIAIFAHFYISIAFHFSHGACIRPVGEYSYRTNICSILYALLIDIVPYHQMINLIPP